MQTHSLTSASIMGLAVLQTVMLTAMFTGTQPHPPFTIPFFAMGPFLGAAIAFAIAALMTGGETTPLGRILALAAAALALLSFGPQKWFDAQFPLIWPAVITAQLAVVAIVWGAVRHWRNADQ